VWMVRQPVSSQVPRNQPQVCSDDKRDAPLGTSDNQGAVGLTSGTEVNGYEV
jgi:hypothetical protein